ncbi:MAG: sigma factor-like helix-turn-helix DNA-binding protein [Acidobacteriota bacterium]
MKRYETPNTRRLLLDRIREALEAMPKTIRETFVLSHYVGLSHAEIACTEAVNENEVVRRLERADSILRCHVSEDSCCVHAA